MSKGGELEEIGKSLDSACQETDERKLCLMNVKSATLQPVSPKLK